MLTFLNTIKALLHCTLPPLSEEDRAINAAIETDDARPFINYFHDNNVRFKRIDHRRMASPSGRVVYERDIYSYVYIDGVLIDSIDIRLPYYERAPLIEEMEIAVLGNIPGTIYHEKKHFGAER